MDKRVWLGVSIGAIVLTLTTVVVFGAWYWHGRGPATAAADDSIPEAKGSSATSTPRNTENKPPRPISFPEGDLAAPLTVPGASGVSPARFEAPVTPEAASGGRAGDGGTYLPRGTATDQLPPRPPSDFLAPPRPPASGGGSFQVTVDDKPPPSPASAAASPALSAPAAAAPSDSPPGVPTLDPASKPAAKPGGSGELLLESLPLPPVVGAGPAVPNAEAPQSNPGLPPPTAGPPADSLSQPPSSLLLDAVRRSGGGPTSEPASGSLTNTAGNTPAGRSSPLERPLAVGLEEDKTNLNLAADSPGPRELEGAQTPSLVLEKKAPAEIQVGKAVSFQTVVRNAGQVTAHNVLVIDRIPQGTRFVNASPRFAQNPDGTIVWQLGSVEPADELTVTMEVMPETEGEIGSVAQVSFQARASVRTRCTKPQLSVEHTAPDKVLVGEQVVFSIKISNPGSGEATGVVLEEDVPAGLVHPAGSELENSIGKLRPGESRNLELVLTAEKAGLVANVIRLRGEGGLAAEHRTQLEVVAPKLEVAFSGPTRRYLERQATYDISVSNPGTATAHGIDLSVHLPQGLQFVSANNQGQYDRKEHAVSWSLDELPAKQHGAVQLTAVPVDVGEQRLKAECRARMGLAHQAEHATVVEGITVVQFEVMDEQDPIEVGSETTYDIKIVNEGSAPATNVRLGAALPNGVSPLNGDGPTRVNIQGQQVTIEPLARLAPGAEAVYRIKTRGDQQGDHVIRVQLASDEAPTPVIREESTKVYADQ